MSHQAKLGVFGAGGRVGQEIAHLLTEKDAVFIPATGIYRNQVKQGFQQSYTELTSDIAKSVDVWIDFTSPESFSEIALACAKWKIPLVSGTTGFSSQEEEILKKISKDIPVLWASNMSLGIAVLRKALPVLKHLTGFDFQLEEFHHNKKKDSPSGTAKTLQKDLEEHLGRNLPEVLAVRGGGIFGVHKIYAMSDEEILTFEHTALNRKVFARGALIAAEWVIRQKPGLYSMSDIF